MAWKCSLQQYVDLSLPELSFAYKKSIAAASANPDSNTVLSSAFAASTRRISLRFENRSWGEPATKSEFQKHNKDKLANNHGYKKLWYIFVNLLLQRSLRFFWEIFLVSITSSSELQHVPYFFILKIKPCYVALVHSDLQASCSLNACPLQGADSAGGLSQLQTASSCRLLELPTVVSCRQEVDSLPTAKVRWQI